MSNRGMLWRAGGVIALVALACTMGRASQRSEPSVVTITARDYGYDVPATIAPGLTTLRLVNEGKEVHEAQLLRLEHGKTVAELAALPPEAPMPDWVVMIGGPGAVDPGGSANATQNLKPGRYALLCFVPSPDGKPHHMKGMVRGFEVAGLEGVAASSGLPSGDATITLVDYGFSQDKPLVAGRQRVRVVNKGGESHELILARLAPGKTMADLLAWDMASPPPASFVGGMVGLSPNEEGVVDLDLQPGDYAMLCFFPARPDGKPHIAHGMVSGFTVKAST